MKLISTNRQIALELGFIFCIGLLSLTWFNDGLMLAASGFEPPIDRMRYFLWTITWWDHLHATGFANPGALPNLLFGMFAVFTKFIGLELINWERLLFFIWFTGSGVSAYILSRVLNLGSVARITASLFYMMNMFTLVIIWDVAQGMVQNAYAFMPLVVGLFLHGLLKKRGIRYIFGLQLLWLALQLFGPAAMMQLTLVYWFTIFAIVVTYSITKLVKRDLPSFISTVKFTILSVVGFALLNSFWLIPNLSQMNQYFTQIYAKTSDFAFIPNIEVFRLNSVQLFNSVRLMGYWPFNGGWEAGQYYPFAPAYANPAMILISFIPVILTIFAIWKHGPYLRLLLPAYFVSLILITGGFPPFGPFNELLFVNFQVFQTSRDVILTWSPVIALCTAQTFGYGLDTLYMWINKKFRKPLRFDNPGILIVLTVLFLVIGVFVFPFWTGQVIHHPTAEYTAIDRRMEIPEYYYDFEEFIDSEKGDFRIYTLPQHKAGVGMYNWTHGYIGSDMLYWFSNRPTVFSNIDINPMLTLLGQNFGDSPLPKESVAELLSMLNIKYIVIHEDNEWLLHQFYLSQHYYQTQDTIKNSINAPNISFVKQIGKLTIYQNDLVSNNHIHTSVNLVLMPDEFEQVRNLLPMGLVDSNSTIIAENENPRDPRFDVGGLTQVLKIDNNVTEFFVPIGSIGNVYLKSPESPKSVLVDDRPYNVSDTKMVDLLNISNVQLWVEKEASMDNFFRDGKHVHWNINRSTIGNRNINFHFESFDMTNRLFEILIDGYGSSNKISYLLYDSDGHYIGWNHVMDWNGTKSTTLSLESPDIISETPILFNRSRTVTFTIYYNHDQKGENKSIVIRALFSPLPSDNRWSRIEDLVLSGGSHTFQLPSGSVEKLTIVSSRPVTPPSVKFSKVAPYEYQVTVNNASSPFYLVFNEGFDRGWKIFDGKLPFFHLLSTPLISEVDHFLGNGFGNAWYMNRTGTYELTIYYYPQAIYEGSLILTVVAFFVMTAVVIGIHNPLTVLLRRNPKLNKGPK